jgi:hypothetical protein
MIYKTLHRLSNMNPRKTKVKLSCSWRVCSYCSIGFIVSWLQWWNKFLIFKWLSLCYHHIRVSLFRCICMQIVDTYSILSFFVQWFVDHYLSFCPLFWTIVISVFISFTAYDFPFDFFKLRQYIVEILLNLALNTN